MNDENFSFTMKPMMVVMGIAIMGAMIIPIVTRLQPRSALSDGLGDLNRDGYVTRADSAIVRQFVAGQISFNDEDYRRADVNGDGAIEEVDAALIDSFIAWQINKFPATP